MTTDIQNELPFSRRDMLKGGGALIIGFSFSGVPGPAAAARGDVAGPPDPNTVDTWIAIHADNTASVYFGKCELGQGNTPQDMFVYEKGGKKYILMNQVRMAGMHSSNPVGPSEYWTARVDLDILTETKDINEKSLWRTRGKANTSETTRAIIAENFHGVMHMDQLDNANALVIRKNKDGVQSLEVVALP